MRRVISSATNGSKTSRNDELGSGDGLTATVAVSRVLRQPDPIFQETILQRIMRDLMTGLPLPVLSTRMTREEFERLPDCTTKGHPCVEVPAWRVNVNHPWREPVWVLCKWIMPRGKACGLLWTRIEIIEVCECGAVFDGLNCSICQVLGGEC